VDLLVRDADVLVTMAGGEIPGGWVGISDGVVSGVGKPGTEPAAAEVISANGSLVTPGLINTHHHIYQNLTRSFAPIINADFWEWLTTLYKVWARLDEEAVYVSTVVGLTELALGGCTTTTDHLYVHPRSNLIDAEIKAARELGFRFHPTRGSMSLSRKDGGLPPDEVVQDDDEILADSERLVKTYHDPNAGAMVRIALAPCSPFSVTPALMQRTAELADRLDVRLHTHLLEDPGELSYCRRTFGCSSMEHFEQVGWGSDRAWVAHCVYPTEAEVSRLGGWRTGIAHCPSANSLYSKSIAPVRALRKAGAPVGLGCDGSSSADHASLWLEARTALLLARVKDGPAAMNARDVLEIATIGSAACLGREDGLGMLRVGAPGDVVVWSLDEIAFAGAHTDLVEAWLRCGPVRARHTIVNGKLLVRDGVPQSDMLHEALVAHRRISREWQRTVAPLVRARAPVPARAAHSVGRGTSGPEQQASRAGLDHEVDRAATRCRAMTTHDSPHSGPTLARLGDRERRRRPSCRRQLSTRCCAMRVSGPMAASGKLSFTFAGKSERPSTTARDKEPRSASTLATWVAGRFQLPGSAQP
jgi:cytosine/adenosine deaminase-related metal-dependent hydrolase